MYTMWVREHSHLELFLKLSSKWCILNDAQHIPFPWKETGSKCIATRYTHENMCIARTGYNVAILAYFERVG